MRIIAIIAVVLFSFSSCKTIKKPNEQSFAEIVYSSSGCFGKCPKESLRVDKKQSVIYTGYKHVNQKGTFRSKITKIEHQRLMNLFEDIRFETLQDDYLSGRRDLQKYTIQYKGKTIHFHERKAPKALIQIQQELQKFIRQLKLSKR